MTAHTSPPQLAPAQRLIAHDIRLAREPSAFKGNVVATIACERRDCRLNLDICRLCPRFARIEVHEAGYIMLCRSADEPA